MVGTRERRAVLELPVEVYLHLDGSASPDNSLAGVNLRTLLDEVLHWAS